jgi:4-amino-4-deoxy-L-arabinose transferase-like glycosyltransferase
MTPPLQSTTTRRALRRKGAGTLRKGALLILLGLGVVVAAGHVLFVPDSDNPILSALIKGAILLCVAPGGVLVAHGAFEVVTGKRPSEASSLARMAFLFLSIVACVCLVLVIVTATCDDAATRRLVGLTR